MKWPPSLEANPLGKSGHFAKVAPKVAPSGLMLPPFEAETGARQASVDQAGPPRLHCT